ncbi:Mitochondrial distribution and morphology protein 34 [Cyphellophora attinorum]|uniref:Mitochondrial distribution and morphology protein 34 n=1 Tax=Cyphellophora attinorum TaxID=1664694 RepID=A0A0N1H3X8_9EURO|nr:Mitochondrial distribution and morphology protein 34 [Phialophora attinorum]KPI39864.1 Mitochondrial distribution and morphology protein 34 [Phialophora attinorum]
MAFNFNWSPLATDATFYQRAKELLTNALNRAGPRPVIIVDDFLVSEFNLGEIPPELEIVEIGDLAEDKFRGTFKMRYQGDANSFATPQPLAAATGLTIPLQITLSEFRLSGFVILVFSKQKGLTIVFKDDPLESLRVSSTFDSIPFVAKHIQGVIEKQLRNLLMEELPAIIHRLSQQFSGPDRHNVTENDLDQSQTSDNTVVDPFASPPQDPVDSKGNVLSSADIASLSLDSSVETQSLFSQKNLIRLATLSDSHRTLSLFTPSIQDAVFRAWTGPLERGEMPAFQSRAATPALSRSHSHAGSLSTYTGDSALARPSLYSFPSTGSSYGLGGGRHGRTRKRKKRVVNLRKQPETGEIETVIEDGSTVTDSASVTESTSDQPSVFSAPPGMASSPFARDSDVYSPIQSPRSDRRSLNGRRVVSTPLQEARTSPSVPHREVRPSSSASFGPDSALEIASQPLQNSQFDTIRARRRQPPPPITDIDTTPRASMYVTEKPPPPTQRLSQHEALFNLGSPGPSSSSTPAEPPQPLPNFLQFVNDASAGGSIAERAWMAKMAAEMSRRYDDERRKGTFGSASGPSRSSTASPPPAYYAR